MTDPMTDTPPEPEAADGPDPDADEMGETGADEIQASASPQEPTDAGPSPKAETEPEAELQPDTDPAADEPAQSQAAWSADPDDPDDPDDDRDPRDDFAGVAPTDRRNPHNGEVERTFYDARTGKPLAAFVIAPDRRASPAFDSEASPFSAGLQSAVYVHPIGSDGSELFERAARPGPRVRYPVRTPPPYPPAGPRRQPPAGVKPRVAPPVTLFGRTLPVGYDATLRSPDGQARAMRASRALKGAVDLLNAQNSARRLTPAEESYVSALKSFTFDSAAETSSQERGVFNIALADLKNDDPVWVASTIIHDGAHARLWLKGTNYRGELIPSLAQEAYLRRMGKTDWANHVREFRVKPALQLLRQQQKH